MSTQMLSAVSALSDRELLEQVSLLAQREREATAALVAHLAVLEERRLYLGEGCSSLFMYCFRVLQLSENAAYRRVTAARVVRAYPVVLDLLADGSISLTTIRLLAPELTPANHRRLLEASKHQPTRQMEKMVAGRRRASRSNSPPARRRTTCCAGLRTCCGIRSRTETSVGDGEGAASAGPEPGEGEACRDRSTARWPWDTT